MSSPTSPSSSPHDAQKRIRTPMTEDSPDLDGYDRNAEESRRAFHQLIGIARREKSQGGEESKEKSGEEQPIPDPTIHLQQDHRPRQYQTELFERAKEGNVIACLDTGSGKTLIAVLLLQHIFNASSPLLQKKISLFIVNLVPLVHQQGDVIESNTCLKVGRLYGGDSRFSAWSKEDFECAFTENDVLVITGQMVVQALAHSFLKMEDINLIIFDEAHHADATHPYSRIMKDYYVNTAWQSRPKIFGLTASPLKTATDNYKSAAKELEATLDAKIFTAPVIHSDKPKATKEYVIEYDAPMQLLETKLTEKIKARCASLESLPKYMSRMQYDLDHHGPLMLDLAWIGSKENFRAKAREKFERTQLSRPQIDLDQSWAEKRQFDRDTRAMLQELDTKRQRWADEALWHKTVAELLDEEPDEQLLPSLLVNETNATPKVRRLIDLLRCFGKNAKTRQSFCGIVFVSRKRTAFALVRLLAAQPCLDFLRIEALYGHDDVDGRNGMDSDAQQATLSRFRKGETNLLVATSVAEEGLDIRPCNCVIRFDLFAHHVGYVQSKGRARHKDSRFIMMVQRNDPAMQSILRKVVRVDQGIRNWLKALPHDRVSQSFDDDDDDDDDDDGTGGHRSDYLEVAETGARIFAPESVCFLCHYVQMIKSDVYAPDVPDYIIRDYGEGAGFSVEVRLPANSKVRYVQGPICSRKKLARNAASLLALKKLREAGELDDYLIPTARNKVKALRSDLPFELDEDGRKMGTQARCHELFAKIPDTFAPGISICPKEGLVLHGIVLRPPSTDDNVKLRHVLLLTNKAFQSMPSIDLRFAEGVCRRFPATEDTVPISLEQEEVLAATSFTLRLFKFMGRKSFEDEGRLPYLILPLDAPLASKNSVDWNEVTRDTTLSSIHHLNLFRCNNSSRLAGEDLLLCERGTSGRLYRFVELDLQHDARHIDPRGKGLRDYLLDEPDLCHQPTEPLIVTEAIPNLDNHLVTNSPRPPTKRGRRWTRYMVPSRACVIPLSASTAETALLLASVLSRYTQVLLAREANVQLFDNRLNDQLLMQAFTSPGTQQAHSYEKLEFFGDMALKVLASLYAFTMTDHLREAELHYTRRALVSNAKLLKHSLTHQLYRFANSKSFATKTWCPPYLKMPHSLDGTPLPSYRKNNTHIVRKETEVGDADGEELLLAEKSLADLVEACMGAAFDKGGVDGLRSALFVAKKLGVLPTEIENLESFHKAYERRTMEEMEGDELAERVATGALKKLEDHIGYRFNSPHLALQAITHSSYMAADLPSYERFEFLGDALLDYFIVTTFREKYNDALDESEMTRIKSNAVSNDAFGVLCIEIGFHHYFSHSSSTMLSTIKQTVEDVNDARKRALEIHGGDETKIGQFWMQFGVKIPKVLGDVSWLAYAILLSSSSLV